MKTPPLARVQFVLKLIGAIAVIAYCVGDGLQQFLQHWYLLLLIVALEAVTQITPFSVNHNGSRVEFTADMIAVVAAALLLPTRVGVLAVPLGYFVGNMVIRREFHLYRLDDLTGYFMGAFVALTVAHMVGAPGLGLNSVVGAVLAGAIYDPFSLLLLTISLVLTRQVQFGSFFLSTLAPSVITYPWLLCLGILLGTIGWDASWALPLMGAPLALVFMASRSRVEATEDRSRLDGLLKATTEILAATTTSAVTVAVASSIANLFETQDGRIGVDGPGEGELGVPLHSERLGNRYLVVPARQALTRSYTEHDRRLLETVASVTASALDKAAMHEDVTEQATRDALTGLANRRAFEAELASSVIGKRTTDASGVMFLDLDGFKKINDEHGHKAGDEVLVETAKRLLQSVRDGDTVARLGGDEFTVLLRGVHNKDEAVIIAERILVAMREPMTLSTGAKVHPTPSLGIALAAVRETDPATLLIDADAAMYEAKRAGKDCWRLAHDRLSVVVGE
jgi:diguanylate cyclase (GGDEF)-like protein